jgi:hypothetical protein
MPAGEGYTVSRRFEGLGSIGFVSVFFDSGWKRLNKRKYKPAKADLRFQAIKKWGDYVSD